MHILLLPSWYPMHADDVTGVFFRDQALALSDFGHKVGVIAPSIRSFRSLFSHSKITVKKEYEVDGGVHTLRPRVFGMLPKIAYGNYWLLKRQVKKTFKIYIKKFGIPDVIHAHSIIYGGTIARDLAQEFNLPLVITEHSSNFSQGLYSKWQLQLAKKTVLSASRCISVSPSLGELLDEYFGTKDRWTWVPNIVAKRFLRPIKEKPSSTALRFLSLGVMKTIKGQHLLIDAFSKLLVTNPSSELWLGGDGPMKEELFDKVEKLGISDNVKFLGTISPSKVPLLFEQVNILVISSLYETFGVVAIEAMASGLPVVATRCGGPECIVTRSDGILVPVNDVELLANAMSELSKRYTDYCAAEIQNSALKRFSSSTIAEKLTVEYKDAIKNARAIRKK